MQTDANMQLRILIFRSHVRFQDLADQVGVNRITIYRWLNHQMTKDDPHYQRIEKAVRELRVKNRGKN